MSLSFRIWWESSKKSCIPSCDMWSVNFLLMTSRATGTGILVNNALPSKETIKFHQSLYFFPLRLSANPLLSFTKEKFLPVYLCKIFVRNFDNLYVEVPQADIICSPQIKAQMILKGWNTLKSLLMHPKDKIHLKSLT